jgi:hypothetical protein
LLTPALIGSLLVLGGGSPDAGDSGTLFSVVTGGVLTVAAASFSLAGRGVCALGGLAITVASGGATITFASGGVPTTRASGASRIADLLIGPFS